MSSVSQSFQPGCTHLSSAEFLPSPKFTANWNFMFSVKIVGIFFTVRNVVAARVMFSQASVILFTGEGFWQTPQADPQSRHPPCPVHAGIHPVRPLQRTVRILLECILVGYPFDQRSLPCFEHHLYVCHLRFGTSVMSRWLYINQSVRSV